jgi:hypothetical protein
MGETTFHLSFVPVWRVATTWSAGIVVVLLWGIGQMAGPLPAIPDLLVVALSGLVGGLVVAVFVRCYPITLTAEGLRGYDAYGFCRLARWEAITGVRPVRFLGLRYLRVYSADTPRPRWLPLFLSDLAGFAAEAKRLAGPDHPLVRALPR